MIIYFCCHVAILQKKMIQKRLIPGLGARFICRHLELTIVGNNNKMLLSFKNIIYSKTYR